MYVCTHFWITYQPNKIVNKQNEQPKRSYMDVSIVNGKAKKPPTIFKILKYPLLVNKYLGLNKESILISKMNSSIPPYHK